MNELTNYVIIAHMAQEIENTLNWWLDIKALLWICDENKLSPSPS